MCFQIHYWVYLLIAVAGSYSCQTKDTIPSAKADKDTVSIPKPKTTDAKFDTLLSKNLASTRLTGYGSIGINEYSYNKSGLLLEARVLSRTLYSPFTENILSSVRKYRWKDAQTLVVEESRSDGYLAANLSKELVPFSNTVIKYDTSNVLTKATITYLLDRLFSSNTYSLYEIDEKKRIKTILTYLENGTLQKNTLCEYDNNDNILKTTITQFVNGSLYTTTKSSYQYDNKPNPFIIDALSALPQSISKNNVVSAKVVTSDQNGKETVSEISLDILYRSDGYPRQATLRSSGQIYYYEYSN